MKNATTNETKNEDMAAAVRGMLSDLPKGLSLIELPMERRGFRFFISAWFFTDGLGRRVLVDPGPACSVPVLFDALSKLTDDIDLVLLTHIHLDHSGGIGQVCERYKSARVIVHPRAKRHLAEPAKLWKGSLETLSSIAEMYKEPLPLPPERIIENAEGIDIIETPGHATHHLCFSVRTDSAALFFLGEAAGLSLPVGSSASSVYLRPTTPPVFNLQSAAESINKIEASLRGDEILIYAHWGATRDHTRIALAKKQLDNWSGIIFDKLAATVSPSGADASRPDDNIIRDIMETIISEDPLISGFSSLPDDIKDRERKFIKNSVTGFYMSCENTLRGA
ncbi:MBL fold metallo-hydrolase [Synergistales bacterium]|nr:MBL fold metallo-hydrolase [Synergistales bacterium]